MGNYSEADDQLMRCWPCFENLPGPQTDTWLHHRSRGVKDRGGQSMAAFYAPKGLLPHRRTIYLVPVLCDVAEAPPLAELVAIVHACYSLPVRLLRPPAELESIRLDREGAGYGPRLDTSDVLSLLEKCKPHDAFTVVGLTMLDLRDGSKHAEGGVPVVGLANAATGVGVVTFARYRVVRSTVTIGDQVLEGYVSGKPDQATFTRRCAMTLCHEIGHLLGIHHCVFARCLMNGSGHLGEAEGRPFQLCPIDAKKWLSALSGMLRGTKLDGSGSKLEGGGGMGSKLGGGSSMGSSDLVLNLERRERAMLAAFERSGLAADAALSRRRLEALEAGAGCV